MNPLADVFIRAIALINTIPMSVYHGKNAVSFLLLLNI